MSTGTKVIADDAKLVGWGASLEDAVVDYSDGDEASLDPAAVSVEDKDGSYHCLTGNALAKVMRGEDGEQPADNAEVATPALVPEPGVADASSEAVVVEAPEDDDQSPSAEPSDDAVVGEGQTSGRDESFPETPSNSEPVSALTEGAVPAEQLSEVQSPILEATLPGYLIDAGDPPQPSGWRVFLRIVTFGWIR